MSLPRFGVTRPVPVNLLMFGLLLAGLFCGITLRRQFFPDMEIQSASVALPYPGAMPEEIEETMAKKVEDAVADLDEVKRLTTTISEGGGGIIVEFHESVSDVTKATDEVERAIDSLIDLPEESENIRVTEFEARLPVIMLSIYGDASEAELKRMIRVIRDDLKTLPGMGEIVISGVRDYEVRIDVDRDALLEHGVSLPQVSAAVRGWMSDLPGGSVRGRGGNINVRTMGVPERAEAIRQIVVKATRGGQSLRIDDIATVRESFVDVQLDTRFRGKPSASLTVFKVGDQDIVKMAEMVRAYVNARQGEESELRAMDELLGRHKIRAEALARESTVPLPVGVNIATHSDLARFVEGRLSLLTRNALQGAVLVFATLLLFLNWRLAFWVGVGLTTALAGTLLVMWVADVTLNLLTMFGLIVVLGILVDDAIVVAENIQAQHDRKVPALVAAIKGGEQVSWPVVATVMTTIVAFLPLSYIEGQMGDMLGALPMVVACALSMSLLESLLILPSHVGHSLLKRDKKKPGKFLAMVGRAEAWRDSVIFDRVVPLYGRFLRVCLNYRYISLSIAIATLIASLGFVAGGRVIYTFLPESDAETLVVDLRMSVGTAVERTTEVTSLIEDAINAQPEIKSISTIIGQRADIDTGSVDSNASHLSQVFVELKPVEERDRASGEVINAIRQQLGVIPDVENLTYREITGGFGGPDITIRAASNDPEALKAVVPEIKAVLGQFDGVYDIFDDNSLGQRELQISLKPGAAALGFTVSNVARQVRASLYGSDAHVFSEREEDIDVRLRVDESTRQSLHATENTWLISPDGRRVSLREVASLSDGTSYSTIRRVDRVRSVTVTAETDPIVSPESIYRELDLAALQAQHPGVVLERGGRQEQQAEAFATLPIGFLAAMIMIYVILAWLFSSYTQPIAVMLGIPFGMIGVIWGHVLLGFEMTFLSMIGFVALAGIVVNDSLILVEFFNKRRADGMPLRDALVDAGMRRLRPIFLTTITTVLGLTPLMLEQSFQARFLIPMAIAIAFGLMSATVLILLILPCIIVIIDDFKKTVFFFWHGRPRDEEPAPDPVFELDA